MIQPPSSNSDDRRSVMFFPSLGRLSDDGRTWHVNVRGAVFDPRRLTLSKRIMLRFLRRFIRAKPEDLESDIFKQRIRVFAAAAQRGVEIAVQIGSQVHALAERSKRNGQFSGQIAIHADDLGSLADNGHVHRGWLRFDLATQDGLASTETGQVQLLSPAGVSVISDIDDTIKHSDVRSRRALLQNTFLHRFQWIEGMARLYQRWFAQGASFHYVSSSPWQLYDALSELFRTEGFPQGTFHLRTLFRLRDHMLRRLFVLRRRGKGEIIRSIVETYPSRRFVLVGDSGEIDPEIYAAVARRFPAQVSRILIRELPQRGISGRRGRKVFRGLPPELWTTFHDPNELPDLLPVGESIA